MAEDGQRRPVDRHQPEPFRNERAANDFSTPFDREVYQDIPATTGRTYIATGWVRTEGAGSGGSISIQWLDAAGKVISADPIGTVAGTTGWTFVAVCGTTPAASSTARFRLHAAAEPDNSGMVWYDDLALYDADETTTAVGTPVAEHGSLLTLHGLRPMPLRLASEIVFDLAAPAVVTLELFDVRGSRVSMIEPTSQPAGLARTITIERGELAPGVYTYRLSAAGAGGEIVRHGRIVVVP